jgi:hypothetical protein
MANLNEADNWPEGIYQIEEDDPVLGGPAGISNIPPAQLAARSRFQRLRNITPWSAILVYPNNAFVGHAGTTWKSVDPSTGVEPGSDDSKWVRWGHTSQEMDALLAGTLGRLIKAQVFSVPGTFAYTPTPGTTSVVVEVLGGGGGGGGAAASGAATPSAGGGGGAGSYGKGRYTEGFSGVTVTVGTGGAGGGSSGAAGSGGASSFGSLLTAAGGGGGTAGNASTTPVVAGASGTTAAAPSGANICAKRGDPGAFGFLLSPTSGVSGRGGSSPYGAGGESTYISVGGVGNTGAGHGGGASGSANAINQAAKAGAAGQGGIVIVWEFS